MGDEFFRFPSIPHLIWLGDELPREDKLLSSHQAEQLLSQPVVVEEKVDGANVGISFDHAGGLKLQNRGAYIGEGDHPQFSPLWQWAYRRIDPLRELLGTTRILFGEWCFAVHTIEYTALEDWFVAFDLYCRSKRQFFSVDRRNDVLSPLDIELVAEVARGQFSTDELLELAGGSSYTDGPMEGVVVRQQPGGPWSGIRAKIVRPEFLDQFEQHWSKRALKPNSLAGE